MGWCPEGVYCLEGTCQPFEFECTDTTFEPNESKDAAVKVTPGEFKVPVQQGLQVCVNDSDWFSLTVPKGSSGTLGIWFLHELGDLDLCAYDAAGKLLGCRYEMEDYPVSWRGNDWNDEFLSALALGGERTVYFKADGYKGIPNDYTLYAWTTAWADGLDCTQSFPFAECKGCGSGCVKEDFKAGLMQFPFADPSDPYVGDGYMLEHSSGYRWVRRETAMLVRYAIHEVQEKFPGTTGLGLMDMCQIDGITPGFDVGNPRHPASTHDEGGNIDVAYYQTDGENNGGVVCDGNGGSNNGYYCTSVANHIVDLPRTAYFLAKLADSPRFRVVGVDQLLAPLILAQLKQQADAGWISAASYNKLKNGALAYGDGWPFHFHHMHVSLLWWSERGHRPDGPIGCGYRMPGDGTWEGYLLGAKP
jgi:hypothetical protein